MREGQEIGTGIVLSHWKSALITFTGRKVMKTLSEMSSNKAKNVMRIAMVFMVFVLSERQLALITGRSG